MGKELALDTDVASFTGAVLGVVFYGGFAAIEWWRVAHLRASAFHSVTWQDYLLLVLLGWAAIKDKNRPVRFAIGCCLFFFALCMAASLLHLSTQTQRLISLWTTLTNAFVLTGASAFLASWLWRIIRDSKATDPAPLDSVTRKG